MTIIAQISDLHVQTETDRAYGIVDTNTLVENAISPKAMLCNRPPQGH